MMPGGTQYAASCGTSSTTAAGDAADTGSGRPASRAVLACVRVCRRACRSWPAHRQDATAATAAAATATRPRPSAVRTLVYTTGVQTPPPDTERHITTARCIHPCTAAAITKYRATTAEHSTL